MDRDAAYLGDAVIATFDGYQIKLRTDDGNDQIIYINPEVWNSLVKYVDMLHEKGETF